MTQTFEEMCAERDPLYAAMQPVGDFVDALDADKLMIDLLRAKRMDEAGEIWNMRNTSLLHLTIRALRNQGQLYYDR